jgi:HAD superfamily hydrolase (TIGR01544 family)
MKNIIIPRPKKLEKIRKNFIRDGAKKLHILSDFDRTLTKAFINGKIVSSLMTSLSDKYLTPVYRQKYRKFFNQYFPIEINQTIKLADKKKAMAQWWQKIFALLIEGKLNKKDLKKFITSQNIKLRNGFDKFANLLKKQSIPLIIMSSSGLGEKAILMYLKREKRLSSNIHIIANKFEWDKNGYAVAVKEPIIHVANKDETILKNFPVLNLIKKRKNVILLGDVIEDTGMIKGFTYDNLIKIGFFSDKNKKNLKIYKSYYDVIVLNDGGLEYVNKLLREITK